MLCQWGYDNRTIVFQRKTEVHKVYAVYGSAPFLGSGGGTDEQYSEHSEVMVADYSSGGCRKIADGYVMHILAGTPLLVCSTIPGKRYDPYVLFLVNWETGARTDLLSASNLNVFISPDESSLLVKSGRSWSTLSLDGFSTTSIDGVMSSIPEIRDKQSIANSEPFWGADGRLYIGVNLLNPRRNRYYLVNQTSMDTQSVENAPRPYYKTYPGLVPGRRLSSPDGKLWAKIVETKQNPPLGSVTIAGISGPVKTEVVLHNLVVTGADGKEVPLTTHEAPPEFGGK